MYAVYILSYCEQRHKSFKFRRVQNFIFSHEAGKVSALILKLRDISARLSVLLF
jgi:hypothetical protein